jgi:hypothetical protein
MGAIAGGIAIANNNASKELCDARNRCTVKGGDLRDSALAASTASTVGFIVGAAGVGAGVILYFTAPKASAAAAPATPRTSSLTVQVAPIVGPHNAGALVTGTF